MLVEKIDIKILEEMLRLINVYGWIQKHEGSELLGFCLIGAERKAFENQTGQFWLNSTVKYIEITRRLNDIYDECGMNEAISRWNDAPERTIEDVKNFLIKSIKYAKSQRRPWKLLWHYCVEIMCAADYPTGLKKIQN
jgi:hypothetical protein